MNPMIDAFFRAAMYCLHPRVIALSFLPLAVMVAVSLGLGYFFWNDAVDFLRDDVVQALQAYEAAQQLAALENSV